MRSLILVVLLLSGLAAPAFAEPTTITVRAIARDAKFIGSGMGGVKVTLTRERDGATLAQGEIKGGTGDTEKLVVQPRVRGAMLSEANDAAYTATVDLLEPTLIRLTAVASPPRAAAPVTVTSMAWVLPGQPVVGDGWVVEFPGLAVTPSLGEKDGRLTVTAKVVLMCGCPVTPGGLWDADNFDVRLLVDDLTPAAAQVFPMAYAGEASTFSVTIDTPKGEPKRYRVTAFDRRTGNAGVGQPVALGRPHRD